MIYVKCITICVKFQRAFKENNPKSICSAIGVIHLTAEHSNTTFSHDMYSFGRKINCNTAKQKDKSMFDHGAKMRLIL